MTCEAAAVAEPRRFLFSPSTEKAPQGLRDEAERRLTKTRAKSGESAYNMSKKRPKPGARGRLGATDIPSWARGETPDAGESGREFAERLLDGRYGPGTYPTGPTSEFSKLNKWADRHFEDP